MSSKNRKFTRRDFIKGSGVALGAAVLAGCVPQQAGTASQVGSDGGGSGEMPKVHLWIGARCRPEGSNPDRLAAVQNVMRENLSIDPIPLTVPSGSAALEKLNLTLGSRSEELDIFVANWPDYKDAIIPLNDLLDEHGQDIIAAHRDINMAGMQDSDGNIWGVPRLGVMGHTTPVWFRTDWLEQAGMEQPQTLEEGEAAMAEFKAIDPEAAIVTTNIQHLRLATVGGFTEHGYSNWFDDQDGKIKPAELQPGFVDWVSKMNEWWNNDWFFKETFASFDAEQIFKSLKVGIWAGWYSRVTIIWERLRQTGEVGDADLNFALNFTGPAGLMKTHNVSATSAYMVTKKAKNPEACIQYMNWQFKGLPDDPTNPVVGNFGEEGVDWEWDDPSDKYFVNRLITGCGDEYAGELQTAVGLGSEHLYAPRGDLERHFLHIRDYTQSYDSGKMPVDFNVAYDIPIIKEMAPGFDDIQRLRDEEIVKFISGIRPLSEWQDFLADLNSAGLEAWQDAHTEQYLKYL
jgi:ABC-type glycerol-3-phosphate transport system substrate-binding protein